jgi:hypothetical protein
MNQRTGHRNESAECEIALLSNKEKRKNRRWRDKLDKELARVTKDFAKKGIHLNVTGETSHGAQELDIPFHVEIAPIWAGILKMLYLTGFYFLGDAFLGDPLNPGWRRAIQPQTIASSLLTKELTDISRWLNSLGVRSESSLFYRRTGNLACPSRWQGWLYGRPQSRTFAGSTTQTLGLSYQTFQAPELGAPIGTFREDLIHPVARSNRFHEIPFLDHRSLLLPLSEIFSF